MEISDVRVLSFCERRYGKYRLFTANLHKNLYPNLPYFVVI
jgi:hypothetical protein